MTDVTGSDINKMDCVDTGLRLHGMGDSDCDIASESLSAKGKQLFPITGNSAKGHSALQH